MKNKLFLRSPAKLNLFLEVLGKREDGYHNIFTLFQSIKLHDEIEIEEKRGKIEIIFYNQFVPERNTVSKTVELLNIKRGLRIKIFKNIPQKAGLGGGSSNAGVVLLGINELLKLNLSIDDMVKILSKVGSDTVFFLYGGTAIGEGRGEIIKSVDDFPRKLFLILLQTIGVSTPKIYSFLTEYGDKSKIYAHFLNGEYSKFYNRLEISAFNFYPHLLRVKERLKSYSSELVLMTGSGSSFFAFDRKEEKLIKMKKIFKNSLLVESLTKEEYYKYIGVSPSGKASDFGSDIRWFESTHPSFLNEK